MADTVWIADPDREVRESLATLLRTTGVEVETFGTGEAVLRRLRDGRPECLVLDIELADMSGLEVLLRIRARHLDVPVIVLASYADVSLAVCALHLGAMDFLEKPIVGRVLLARVQEGLGHAQARFPVRVHAS
jgi:two-component system response regulator FixJ